LTIAENMSWKIDSDIGNGLPLWFIYIVGIYLPRHVFSHSQLYVALSRGVFQNSTKVLIKQGKIERDDGDFMKNVFFKDILLSQSYQCFFYITYHLYIYVMMLLITIIINNKWSLFYLNFICSQTKICWVKK